MSFCFVGHWSGAACIQMINSVLQDLVAPRPMDPQVYQLALPSPVILDRLIKISTAWAWQKRMGAK